ncbi:MAG: SAM-dependent DNA methyltransferase [Chloroflexi bacterium]|nr:SAM-dependent DNA methyltransferase [Chloroflexota bacterium]
MGLDIKTLESWLWDAACSIRGALDAPKFKDYILPLIFAKRLSDVFDDEIARLTEAFGDEKTARALVKKDHSLVRFYIPPKGTWSEIRQSATKVGERVTDAMRAIARENPALQGVIDIVDFNATVSGQRILDDGKLWPLIEIISRHRLGLADAEPDILGRAYEYLLRKFAEGQGQSAGEFYTPKEVGWLMAYLLDPQPGQSTYDPACGSAGLLVKCQLVARERANTPVRPNVGPDEDTPPLQLYGQELNHVTFAIAKMNMIIHDMEGEIVIGDTLRNPKLLERGKLKQFDLVAANPMWNQDGYTAEFYENDPFERFTHYPPASSADWGWAQHMAASLDDSGRAAIVLDTGAVSRGSGGQSANKEKEARRALTQRDWIEGVVLLPENLFYNTTAPGIILLLNKRKPAERRGQIMLINTSQEFEKGRPKNFIPDSSIRKIAEAFHRWQPVEKFARIITLAEAEQNDYNLSPSRYVDTGEAEQHRGVQSIIDDLASLEAEAAVVDDELNRILRGLGYQAYNQ